MQRCTRTTRASISRSRDRPLQLDLLDVNAVNILQMDLLTQSQRSQTDSSVLLKTERLDPKPSLTLARGVDTPGLMEDAKNNPKYP